MKILKWIILILISISLLIVIWVFAILAFTNPKFIYQSSQSFYERRPGLLIVLGWISNGDVKLSEINF